MDPCHNRYDFFFPLGWLDNIPFQTKLASNLFRIKLKLRVQIQLPFPSVDAIAGRLVIYPISDLILWIFLRHGAIKYHFYKQIFIHHFFISCIVWLLITMIDLIWFIHRSLKKKKIIEICQWVMQMEEKKKEAIIV